MSTANASGDRVSREFVLRVHRLRSETAVAGWDGPRSVAIRGSRWDGALKLVEALTDAVPGLPEPRLSADSGGSIYFRWATPEKSFDIEAEGGTGAVYYHDSRKNGEYVELAVGCSRGREAD